MALQSDLDSAHDHEIFGEKIVIDFDPNRTGGCSCFLSAAAKRLKQLNCNLQTFYVW